MYFGPEEEATVLEYLATRDEQLYRDKLHPLLHRIAWGVAVRNKFAPRSLFQSDSVLSGCVNHLWEVLAFKFEPERGKKAYSFLTYCAKTHFCAVAKKYRRSDTFKLMRNQTILDVWESSHEALPSPEETNIDKENQDYRIGVAHDFLAEFMATPEEVHAIFSEIDALPNPHKKAINDILARVLRLDKLHRSPRGIKKKPIEGYTAKRIINRKHAFLERIEYYKSIGYL